LLNEPPIVVLIVEDDLLLRMLATEVVVEAGFAALEAADADEAIALLEARSDIALLSTDIDVPGSMDGIKLAHAVCDAGLQLKFSLSRAKPVQSLLTFRRIAGCR
jgi:CheY-like chemotaxis protein